MFARCIFHACAYSNAQTKILPMKERSSSVSKSTNSSNFSETTWPTRIHGRKASAAASTTAACVSFRYKQSTMSNINPTECLDSMFV